MNFKTFAIIFLAVFITCGSVEAQLIEKSDADSIVLSNIDAYFKSHIPSKVVVPFETKQEYLERMQWWMDAKYGMFIHWGLYSILGGEYNGEVTPKIAEWIQNTLKIPLAEYQKLVKKFNPESFDADALVQLAKIAGMKYIVFTSKHHDGFAMFDSKVSDYNIMNTPYNKDIVKELKEACYKHGLKFGLYYSHTIDWEHPHAYIGEGKLQERMNTVDFDPKKMDRSVYLKEKSFPQLKEILTNFGTIDIIWFDMGGGLSNDEIRQFVKQTRELQPNIIISSRLGNETAPTILDRGMLFDFFTPSDNYFTGDDLDMPWEMAGTTNGSWGYRKDDNEWRDPKLILSSLISSISRGGNYLLNVGPDGNGIVPNEAVKNLKIAGNWLKNNEEAVFGTTPSPFPWNYNWGYVTRKQQNLYLSIFNWPSSNKIVLNGLINKIDFVKTLDGSTNLKFEQQGRFLTIDLSDIEKNDLAVSLVANYSGEELEISQTISQDKKKLIRLDRIAGVYDKDNYFSSWEFDIHTPGKFKIQVISNEKGRHSAPKWTGAEQEGSIQIAGEIIPLKLSRDREKINTSLFFYKEITSNAGEIEIKKSGTYKLQLKGFQIGAGKWTKGLGLSHINLIPLN